MSQESYGQVAISGATFNDICPDNTYYLIPEVYSVGGDDVQWYLEETTTDDFNWTAGETRTITIAPPVGFEFNPSVGNVNGFASDFNSLSFTVAPNEISVTLGVDGTPTNELDIIWFHNFEIRTTTSNSSGNITRSGGTAPVDGFAAGSSVASLNSIEEVSIDTQPSATSVCDGTNTFFSVTASGENLTYQWQVSTDNGMNFSDIPEVSPYSDVTTANLVINSTSSSLDQNLYRVVVSSSTCGPDVTSDEVLLSVNELPAIGGQPSDEVVCENDDATFSVSATGASLSYQWQRDPDGAGSNPFVNIDINTDGGIYSNFTSPVLQISNAPSSTNNNEYRVVITGACLPLTTSSVATLTVNSLPSAPSVTNQNQEICLGETLSAPIASGGAGNFRWYNDANLSSFIIEKANPTPAEIGFDNSTAGTYTVYVTENSAQNCEGEATAVSLIVNPSVNSTTITTNTSPSSTSVCDNETLTFTLTNTNTSRKYQLLDEANNPISTEVVGNGGNLEIISEAFDRATYGPDETIRVRETILSSSCTAILTSPSNVNNITINELPNGITATESNVCSNVATGYSLSAIGASTYNISINSNGLPASAGSPINGTSFPATEISDDAWLNNTGATVNVVYTITPVSSANCEGAPFDIAFPIDPIPTITTQPAAQTECSGNAASFTVAALGNTLTYQWQKGGIDIVGSTDGGVYTDFTTATLNITDVTGLDGSNYNVIVTESGGTQSCPITSNSVDLNVNPITDADTDQAIYAICSGESTSISINNPNTVSGTTFSWTAALQSGAATGFNNGSGASINQILTTSSTAGGVVRYTITPTANGCPGTAITRDVAVNPNPTLTITNNATEICSGDATDIDLSSPTANHQINLVNVTYGAVTGGTASGPYSDGDNIAETLNNATNNPVVVTYEFEVTTTDGCPVTPVSQFASVTVNPLPTMSINNTITDICSNESTSITLNSTTTNANIRLDAVNNTAGVTGFTSAGVNFADGDIITDALVNNTAAPITITYSFSVTVDGCPDDVVPFTTDVTVNPNPTLTITNNATEICSGDATDIDLNSPTTNHQIELVDVTYNTVTGGTSNPGDTFTDGANIAETLNNATNNPVVVTYEFEVTTTDGCPVTPVSQFASVTVNPIPDADTDQAIYAICSGESTSISINNPNTVSGTTFSWTAALQSGAATGFNNGSGASINQILTTSSTAGGVVRYTITPTANGCPGTAITRDVAVNPNPTLTITNNATEICSGDATDIDLSSPTANHQINLVNVTYGAVTGGTASGPYSDGDNIAETLNNATNNPVVVTYEFEVTTTDGCPVTPVSQFASVTVNPLPTMSINNTITDICSNESTSITLNSTTTNANIRLDAVNNTAGVTGFTSAGVNFADGDIITDALVNNTAAPITITYSFSVTVDGCPDDVVPFTTDVTVNPNPTLTITNNATEICSGDATDIDLNSPTTNHQIELVDVTYGAVTGGTSNPGDTFTDGANIAETLNNATNNPVIVTYEFEVTTTDGCPVTPVSQFASVTVNPIPNADTDQAIYAICSGESTSISINNPNTVSGTTFSWTAALQSGAATGFNNGSGASINQILTTSSTAGGVVRYTITPTANGCPGTAITRDVAVNPNPTLTITNNATEICSGDATDIDLSSPTANHQINLVNVTYGAVTGGTAAGPYSDGDNIAETLNNATNDPIIVTYEFQVVTTDGCPVAPVSQFASVTVNPLPTMSINNTITDICSNETTSITLNSTTTNANIRLDAVNNTAGVTGFTSAGVNFADGDIITDALVNNTAAPITITYSFSVTVDGCPDDVVPFTTDVTVNPNPTLTITNNATEICSGDATDIDLNSPTTNHQIELVDVTYGAVTGGTSNPGDTFTDGANIAETLNNATNNPVVVTYEFEVTTTDGCPVTPVSQFASVTVNPLPTMSINNTITDICSNESTSITLNSTTTNANIRLDAVNNTAGVTGFTSAGVNFADGDIITDALVNNTAAPITITYSFSVTVDGCPDDVVPFTTDVTVNPNPTLTITNNATEICSGDATDIDLSSPTANHQINLVNVTYGAVTGGTSNPGDTFTDGANIAETLNNATNNPVIVTYEFEVTTTDGCPVTPVSQFASVTVNPLPTMSINNTITDICSNESTSITLNSTTTNANIRLDAVNNTAGVTGFTSAGVNFADGDIITDALVNNTAAPITITYSFSVTVDGCPDDVVPFTTDVTVNPNPTLTITNNATEICSGDATDIDLNSPTTNHQIELVDVTYGAVTGGTSNPGDTFTDGANIAETLNNATNNPVIVTYEFEVTTTDGCPVTPVSQFASVTVNPLPTMSINNTITDICSNESTSITLNSTTTNANIRLDAVNNTAGVTGFTSAGVNFADGDIITDALVNNTAAPITITYSFSVTVDGCPDDVVPFTTDVTVNPNPTLTITNNATEICSGDATDIDLNSPTTNHQIELVDVTYNTVTGGTSNPGDTFTDGANIAETLNNATNNPVVVTYEFEVTTTDGCPVTPVSQFASVTVNPIPDADTDQAIYAICSGESTSISINNPNTVSGTTFSWTAALQSGAATGFNNGSGASINQILTTSSTAGGVVRYTITPTANGCPGTAITRDVAVNPNPTLTITNNATEICSGDATDIDLSSPTANHQINLVNVTYGAVTGGTAAGHYSDGDNIAETLNNATNDPIIVTYEFQVVTTDGCPVAPVSQFASVTVNPLPTMSINNTITDICSNESTSITLNSTTTNANIRLDAVNNTAGVTGFTSAGVNFADGDIITDALVNNTAAPITITYSFSVTVDGCPDDVAPFTTDVTVNPNPTLTITNNATEICSGDATDIDLNSPTTNHQIELVDVTYNTVTGGTSNPGDTFTDGANIAETLNNATNNPVVVTYEFEVTTTDGCPVTPVSQFASVTVNPIPDADTDQAIYAICSGESTSISINNPNTVSGTTFSWTAALQSGAATGFNNGSGASINQILTTSSTAGGVVRYTITPTANGCPGTAITRDVAVNPNPTLTITNNATEICSGDATDIDLSSPTANHQINLVNVTYGAVTGGTAAGPYSDGDNIAETLNNATNDPIIVTYEFQVVTTDGCPVAPVSQFASVTVNPLPTMSINNTITDICSNESTSITLNSTTTNANIRLDAVNNTAGVTGFTSAGVNFADGDIITDALVNNTAAPITITYSFSVTVDGCPDDVAPFTTDVTVNPNPTLTITNNATEICSGDATDIDLNSPTTNHQIELVDVTYNTVTGGTSNPGDTFTDGANIAETLNNATNNPVVVTYEFEVTTTDGCPVTPVSQFASVTVNPIPDADTDQAIYAICSGESTSISINNPNTVSGTTFSWTAALQSGAATGFNNGSGASINQILTTSSTAGGVVRYTITPTANGCPGTAITRDVAVNPNPTLTITNNATEICSGDATDIDLSSPTANHQINLVNVTYGAVTGGTAAGPYSDGDNIAETLNNATNDPIIVTYEFQVVTTDGCPVAPVSQFASVTVNPLPTMSINNTITDICSNESTSITLNSTTTNANIRLDAVNNTAGVTGFTSAGVNFADGDIITDALVNNTAAPITITYSFSVTVDGCPDDVAPFTTDVTVNPNPTLTITNNATEICSGDATDIDLNSPTTNHQIELVDVTYNTVTGGTSNPGDTFTDGANIAETLNNATNNPVIVTYEFEVTTTDGCPVTPVSQFASVTVNPIPDADTDQAIYAICSGESTSISINNPNTVSGTTFSWTAALQSGAATGFNNGSGASINQILTTSSTAGGVVRYTITPTANGCPGTAITRDVAVNPNPTLTITNNATEICSGDATDIDLSSPTANHQINLVNVTYGAVTGGTAAGPYSDGDNIAETLNNATNDPIIVTYEFQVVTTDGCPVAPVSQFASVTVNPIPNFSNLPASTTICSGEQLNFTPTSDVPGTIFTWTVSAPPEITGESSGTGTINNVLTNIGTSSETVIYTLTATGPGPQGCVNGTSQEYTVTVRPEPEIDNIFPPEEICENENIFDLNTLGLTATPSGPGGFFSFDGPGVSGTNFDATVAGLGIIEIEVTYTSPDGCVTVKDINLFDVVELPTSTLSAMPTEICETQNLDLVATIAGGATSGTWALTGGNTIGSVGATVDNSGNWTATFTPSGNAFGTVTAQFEAATSNSCASNFQTYTFDVFQNPTATLPATFNTCGDASFDLNATLTGSTVDGEWTVNTNGNAALLSTSITAGGITTATYTPESADYGHTITFQFEAFDPVTGPCSNNTYTVDVDIDEPAAVTISTTPENVCQTQTISLSGTFSGSATNASWSENGAGSLTNIVTSGSTVTADYNPTSADIGNTVRFTLTTNNPAGTCNSVSDQVDFVIEAPAQATVTTSIDEICETQDLDLIATIAGGATSGTWAITGGNTIGSVGTTVDNSGNWTATFTPSGSAFGTVTAQFEASTSNNCSSEFETYTFDVFQNPTATLPATFNTCGDASFDLNATLTGSTVDGEWTVNTNGNAALLSTSNTAGGITTATYTPESADYGQTITFQFEAFDPVTGPCSNNTYTVDVDIDEPAAVTISTAPANVCQTQTISLSGTFSGSATNASWSENGAGLLTNISTSGNTVTADYNPTTADIGNTVTFTLTTNDPANTCGSVSQTLDFVIDAPATATITTATTEICETQSLDLIATIGGGATSGNWTITGGNSIGSIGATVDNSDDWTATFTPSGTAFGTVTAQFESSTSASNDCPSAIETFTFDVFENPTATVPSNFSTCGDASFNLNATLTGATLDGDWTIVGPSSGSLSTTTVTVSDAEAIYTPTAGDYNNVITFQFTAIDPATLGPCGDNTYTVDVDIDEPAAVTISTTPENVCQTQTISLSGTFSGSATSASWSENGAGSLTNIVTTGSTVTADYNPTSADIGNTVRFTLTTNNPAGTCNSVSDQVDFVIEAPAQATVTTSIDEICETQDLDLIATIAGGATSGTWAITGGNTIGSVGTTVDNSGNWTATFTPSGSAFGTVTAQFEASTSNNCSSEFETYTFDVFQNPTATLPATFNTCGDASFDLNATLTGSTVDGEWTVNTNGNAALLSTSNTAGGITTATYTPESADYGQTITFQFEAFDPVTGPCSNNTYTVDVDIDEPAAVTISTAPANVCQTQTISLSGTFSGSATNASWSENGAGLLTNISTSGNTVTADYNPTTADIGNTVTFTLTTNDPANTCGSVSQTLDFVIDAPATATITTATTEICETQSLDLIATIGGGATSGNWTITGGNSIGSIGATVDNSDDWTATFTPSGTAFGTVTAQFESSTSASNDCPSAIETFTFDVFENPTASVPSNFSTCGDASFNLNATLGGSATDGRWTVLTNGNSANLADNSAAVGTTTDTYTPDASDYNTTITFQFEAFDPAAGPCGDNTYTVEVTIDEPAEATLVAAANAICETEPITLGGTINTGASSGQWIIQSGQADPDAESSGSLSSTSNNGGTYEATFTPNGTYEGDVIFEFIAISATSCDNDTITKTVAIRGLPVVNNTSDAFCETNPSGGTATVNLRDDYNGLITSESGVTIEWFSNSSLATAVPDETSVSVIDNSTYYAKVTLTSTNCFDVGQVDFTVDPQVILDAGGPNVEICDGQVLNLANIATPPSQSNADDLAWFTSGDGFFDDPTALRPIYTPAGNDFVNSPITLRLEGTNTGLCGLVSDVITLNIKQTPVVTAADNISLCSEEFASIPFTVDITNPILNVSIDDPTLVQGGISIIDGNIEFTTSINTSNADKTGVISLTATQNGCSTVKNINLTLKYRPVVDPEADEAVLCYPAVVPNRTFTHASGTGTFNWEVTNPTLIGDATPAVGTGPFPGFDLADNQTGVPIDGYVRYYSERNGCLSVADSFKITSNPRPVVQNTNVTFCAGENVNIDFIDNVGGTSTFDWTIDNTTIGIAFPFGSTDESITPSGFTATNPSNSTDNVAIINVTSTQDGPNGCEGPEKTITVTVLPNPELTNTNFDFTVCSNETFEFVPVATITDAGFEWNLVSGNTSVVNGLDPSGTGNISLDLVNTSNINQEVVYEIIPKNGSCLATANSEELTIIIRPEIKFDGINNQYFVCSGQDFDLPIEFVNDLTNVEFVWTVAANSAGASDGSGNTVSGNLTNSISGERDTVQYTLNTRFQDGTCSGESAVIDVIVNPNAIVAILPVSDLCEGDNALLEAQLLNGAATGQWSGGLGTFTSTSSPVTSYSPAPSEIGESVTLRFTANDPDGSGPCTSVFDEITFNVNPLPEVAITNDPFPNDLYCIRNGVQELTGSPIGGSFTGRGIIEDAGIYYFDPQVATVGGPYTITYEFTDANGCTNSVETPVEVTNGPNSNFDMETDDSNGFFCANAFLELEPEEEGGTFTGDGIEILGGVTYFNAASNEVTDKDTVNITYTVFEDETSCTAITTKQIVRIPEPEVQISYQNICDVDNAVQITINPGYNNEQDSLISFELEYENSPNRIYEEGQIEQFNSPGTKEIRIIGITALGCTFETTTTIDVGNIQRVDFSVENVKTSLGSDAPTQFTNQSILDGSINGLDIDSIVSFRWDFGVPGINTDIATTENPSYRFEAAGSYNVKLVIESSLGCSDSITKKIDIVPAINTYPYLETFNEGSGGWFTEARDTIQSSWIHDFPNGEFEGQNDNPNPVKIWKTVLQPNNISGYKEGENSYLVGPTFDMTSLEKPMIAFDMWLDVDDNFRAGAILEFSTDGENWTILGAENDELNWYNTSNISPIGGIESNEFNYAWYFQGEERNWIRVAHVIDQNEISSLESVKFRINFKGTVKNSDPTGMAIDNFYVGERQKLVLLENFTNLNSSNYATSRSNIQVLEDSDVSNDILPLNFHISTPAPDSINLRNSVELDGRASIYSIEESPTLIVDGQLFEEDIIGSDNQLLAEFERIITRRSLLEPTEYVNINIDENANENQIRFATTLQPNLDTTNHKIAHFFIVEKSTNPESDLKNIVRKIIPDINGVDLNDLAEETTFTYVWEVNSIYTNDDLAIVTIVQERNTNSIVEVSIEDINQLKVPKNILDIEKGFDNIGMTIYPNPSRGTIYLQFSKTLNEDLQIMVTDTNGKIIKSSRVKSGISKSELDLQGIASGLYQIITKNSKGQLNRKKVVIID